MLMPDVITVEDGHADAERINLGLVLALNRQFSDQLPQAVSALSLHAAMFVCVSVHVHLQFPPPSAPIRLSA